MSAIHGKDTKPEMLIRRGLHARGFRFRLHDRKLPGRPDLVFPKHRAVIFVNGCFWHGHECAMFRWPKSREEFWREKIEGNRARDRKAVESLASAGWRRCTIWECALSGKGRLESGGVILACEAWLGGTLPSLEMAGKP